IQGQLDRLRRGLNGHAGKDRRDDADIHGPARQIRSRGGDAKRRSAAAPASGGSERAILGRRQREDIWGRGRPPCVAAGAKAGDNRLMPGTIGPQAASDPQGVVPGVTPAQSLPPPVFCTLIAVGVGPANDPTKLLDAMLRLKQVEAAAAADKAIVQTIKRNPRLTELLSQATGSTSQREIDEFWRKLVESNDVVAKLGRQGVSLVALKEESDSF